MVSKANLILWIFQQDVKVMHDAYYSTGSVQCVHILEEANLALVSVMALLIMCIL